MKIDFEETCIEHLNEKVGDAWRKYGFESLYQTVLEILDLDRHPPPRMTVTTGRLLNVLQGERARVQRIDEYNRQQEEERKANR